MMAWDEDCSSWDDIVDMANSEQHDFGPIPDASLVMTTWHENEPLEEVTWFSEFAATHPVVKLDNLVLVHVSAVDRSDEFEALFRSTLI